MKRKKNEARHGFTDKSIIKKLIVDINTPTRIGQILFPEMTGVFLENQKKQNQCAHCERWFDWLPVAAVRLNAPFFGKFVALCAGCFNSLSILPPSLQDSFWRKVEANVKKFLEVKSVA